MVDNRIASDQPDARRFADETLLVLLLGLLCGLAGRRVQPVRLDWAHPRPAHADEYARMFAPLGGTIEDPATGSAAGPLGALLLSLPFTLLAVLSPTPAIFWPSMFTRPLCTQ